MQDETPIENPSPTMEDFWILDKLSVEPAPPTDGSELVSTLNPGEDDEEPKVAARSHPFTSRLDALEQRLSEIELLLSLAIATQERHAETIEGFKDTVFLVKDLRHQINKSNEQALRREINQLRTRFDIYIMEHP